LLETLDSTDEALVPVADERAELAELVIDDSSEETEDEMLAALEEAPVATEPAPEVAAVATEVPTDPTAEVMSLAIELICAYGSEVSQQPMIEIDS